MAAFFTGCKKDKDKENKPTCRIITVTPTPAADAINISYNSDGKVSSVINGTTVSTTAYSGNTAINTTMTGSVFNSKRIITMNAAGLATNVRTEFDEHVPATSWTNLAFEYSGEELLKSTSTSSTGGVPSIILYTWSNHNMTAAGTGPSGATLDYYTDKNRQEGDYLLLSQAVQGYEIYRSKNLIKSVLEGSNITSFEYTFDSDGKISSVTATSGATVTVLNYQYQCN